MCTAKISIGKCVAGLQRRAADTSSSRRPARRPARTACEQQRERERQDPETEVVHARQRHVRRADLQRNHPVRKADERRHDRAEDHDQRVHGRHRVEEHRIDELQTRLEQLGANDHRHRAADEEHRQAEQQVHRADVLVVRREHPAAPALLGTMMVVRIVMMCVDVTGVRMCSAHELFLPKLLFRRDGRGRAFNWASAATARRRGLLRARAASSRSRPATSLRRRWA